MYLQSASDVCNNTNICQNYFCNKNFKSKKCPLVDAYMSYITQANITSSSSNITQDINYSYNRTKLTLVQSTEYNKTILDTQSFQNLVFVPIIGMAITRNGKCNLKDDSNLQADYSVIGNIDCPRDQTYYDFYTEDMKQVLNNNDNYFDILEKQLPLFSKIVNTDVKWSIGLEYAFYRNSIGCLLSKYSTINRNSGFRPLKMPDGRNATLYEKKKFQLQNILSVFVNFMETYTFQNYMQIAILIINCFVIFFNLVIIFYKISNICCSCPQVIQNLVEHEGTFSFFLDFVIAILGGVSYFIIKQFIDLIGNLLNTDCIDNSVQYQFGVFNDALDSTAEQNFQIFLFMIFKIVIIVLSVLFYMMYKKCSFRCRRIKKIIMETINEGEDEMDLEALKMNTKEIEENSEKPKIDEKNNDKGTNSMQNKSSDKGNKNINNLANLVNIYNHKQNDSDKNKNQPSHTEMIKIIKENEEEIKREDNN